MPTADKEGEKMIDMTASHTKSFFLFYRKREEFHQQCAWHSKKLNRQEKGDRLYDETGTQSKSRATLSCCPLRIYIRATQRNSITLTVFRRVFWGKGGRQVYRCNGKELHERKLNLRVVLNRSFFRTFALNRNWKS